MIKDGPFISNNKHFHKVDIPSDDILTQCMHCGLCLPECPTYNLTMMERSSPRGRIRLIKEVAAGRLPLTKTFVEEMYFCLDCQACVTVCPEAAIDLEGYAHTQIKSMIDALVRKDN